MANSVPVKFEGSNNFVLGMDGFTHPQLLSEGEYVEGLNVICRGGMIQTRPGSASSPMELPDGNFQGITLFTPNNGIPNLVFAINGNVYVSPQPFNTFSQLQNIKFSAFSRFVTWSSSVKTAEYDDDGNLIILDIPKAVLVMQDGNTRAAYWDGSTSAHLNPANQETPVGLWMKWSNNRLWVSRGAQIFASDIGNPLSFTESQYINEGRSFYLTGPCTGIAETSDKQGIICFTKDNGSFLNSSIQDRTQWLSTPGFQQLILPNVGCVSGRSIVQQYGLLWWWTERGLISQDDALRINITSRLDVRDNEMIQSKMNLSYDLSGVAGGTVENFLFHAVPNGNRFNTRVHVLDQAPFEMNQNSWPSYWTGWNPIEFACGKIGTSEKVFFASTDDDGKNRIWELFRNEKTDNGIPITSYFISRRFYFGNKDYKKFRFAEIELENIVGPVAVMACVAGTRGAFQPIMVKDINALHGQIYPDQTYGPNLIANTRPQTRTVKTQDVSAASQCNSNCVESKIDGMIDKAFTFMLIWSGQMGVSGFRMFVQDEPEFISGVCEENETGEPRIINAQGCGAMSLFLTTSPFTRYVATARMERTSPSNEEIVVYATRSSIISQTDANRRAAAAATYLVRARLGELV